MKEVNKLRSGSIYKKLSFLAKDSIFYGITGSLARMFQVILLPILTRIFSKDEYATIDSLTILGYLILSFLILGQDTAVARYFYESSDKTERKKIVSEGLFIELIWSTIICSVCLIFSKNIYTMYMSNEDNIEIFYILIPAVFFQGIVQYWQNLLKWTFKRSQYFIMNIGHLCSTLLLTLGGIFIFNTGIKSVFYGYLIANICFSLLGFFFCKSYVVIPSKLIFSKRLITYGYPYMLIMFFSMLIPALDRYFIINYFDLNQLAIYAVAYRVAMVIKLPIEGFKIAWAPFAYAIYKEDDANSTYDSVLIYYTLVLFTFGSLFCFLADYAIAFFAPKEYIKSYLFIYPLVMGIIFNSIGSITSIGIGLSKKTYYYLISYLSFIAATIGIIFILINQVGIYGVAIGIMLGHLLFTIIKTFIAFNIYSIKMKLARPIFIAIVLTVYLLSFIYFNEAYNQTKLLIKLAYIIILPFLSFSLLKKDEIQLLKQKIKSKLIFK